MADDRLARRNVGLLMLASALAGANTVVFFSIAAIVGAMIAPSKALATLPITIYVIGLASAAVPVGAMVQRYGRRVTYMAATIAGALAGLTSAAAIVTGSFWLFCFGGFFVGFYASAVQTYRFAAADSATEAFKPKAISLVLAGGLAAGVLGPQLVVHTKTLWQPYLFAATCLFQTLVALIACLVVAFVKAPTPAQAAAANTGEVRPLSEILRQPRLIAAIIAGTASYMLMNFSMTAAPLAMVGCDLSVDDAALGVQWHVIAMYGPSFFTGSLIARFGVERVVLTGLALIGLSAIIALSGTSLAHFWISLIALGVGWNFGYIGATSLVTQCYRPSEKVKVQSANDLIMFSSMAIGSFASGSILNAYGWDAVNAVMFPPLVLAVAALLYAGRRGTTVAVPR